MAETALGTIEYSVHGNGPPVILVHGVVGGCDQGYQISESYIGQGFRCIAISRFGYLRSPLPADPSPARQADVIAGLLDVLEIRKATLVGTSAGGPCLLQFGLRHPDRCSALILWSMAVPGGEVPSRALRSVLEAFFGSDLVFWVLIRCAPSLMLKIMGVPRPVEARLTSREREWLSELMRSFLPVSMRIKGIMNDICISNPDLNKGYQLEQLRVPTLIVHAVDDPKPPFAKAKRMADQVPNARFLRIPHGGHLLLGHHESLRMQITDFIREYASVP